MSFVSPEFGLLCLLFFPLYWALVVGWMSVPMLSTTAMRPASNTGSSGASPGASANC